MCWRHCSSGCSSIAPAGSFGGSIHAKAKRAELDVLLFVFLLAPPYNNVAYFHCNKDTMQETVTNHLRWRLALNLGSASLGWAVIILNKHGDACGIARSGVRLFATGRTPDNKDTMASHRRQKRAERRRRDRILRRFNRQIDALSLFGFVLKAADMRKDPYLLRARALDNQLTPSEFARVVHHISKHRGYNGDIGDTDGGPIKAAIKTTEAAFHAVQARTFGEWLWQRRRRGEGVRAKAQKAKAGRVESYVFYPSRQMVRDEFDAVWRKQAEFNSALFTQEARLAIEDAVFFQRPLHPVDCGRCTLLPEEYRAPIALPVAQRFRILQDVNHLRIDDGSAHGVPLTENQRQTLVSMLVRGEDITFAQIKKKVLGVASKSVKLNLEGKTRTALKGDATARALSSDECFGEHWHELSLSQQDDIVWRLLGIYGYKGVDAGVSMSERKKLIEKRRKELRLWLSSDFGVDEAHLDAIEQAALPGGYGALSRVALQRIVPKLQESEEEGGAPRTYDKAVRAAGFASASDVDGFNPSEFDAEEVVQVAHRTTGELRPALGVLPYYGRVLRRHVAFGSSDPKETNEEKRFGRIANPTVHIGLNQVRQVVNALMRRYGRPDEIVVELTRDLKQGAKARAETQNRNADNQARKRRIRKEIAEELCVHPDEVRESDVVKYILWEELSREPNRRCCPYSGKLISIPMLLSRKVEVGHILPYALTLDNSMNNRTVCLAEAIRAKGGETPWGAREQFERLGWKYEDIVLRAGEMEHAKAWRFAEGIDKRWLHEVREEFLSRALNDTSYLSRLARLYLESICPFGVRAAPGRITGLLRHYWGLNTLFGSKEERVSDYRRHAVDACVVGCVDHKTIRRVQEHLTKIDVFEDAVSGIPAPWRGYRDGVRRAIESIKTSRKPDHASNTAYLEESAYSWPPTEEGTVRKKGAEIDAKNVAPIINAKRKSATNRHWHSSPNWQRGKKSYVKTNYAFVEIVQNGDGWEAEFVPVFETRMYDAKHLPKTSLSGKPLVMRLRRGDVVELVDKNGGKQLVRITRFSTTQKIVFYSPLNNAGMGAGIEQSKTASSLQRSKARLVRLDVLGGT